jgi:hypothetical protein
MDRKGELLRRWSVEDMSHPLRLKRCEKPANSR